MIMLKKSACLFALVLGVMIIHPDSLLKGCFSVAPAYGDEGWKDKIGALCSKTDVAMGLSSEELKALIAGCDQLGPVIEALEETPRKVYRKRLKMCRDLFAYVLETRESKEKQVK